MRCGAAPAAAAAHAAAYRDWVARGYAAQMTYMTRQPARRTDPRLLLEGARSVLSLAVAYPRPAPAPLPAGCGRVAAFAQGPDYHESIAARLEALSAWLHAQLPGAGSRCFVDTGPLLERDLAQQAGVGWCGKNTCLISREAGSYVFLAEIVTVAPLPHTPPATPRCGNCTACLQACPTGALRAPNVLDASRCISYLTIEHRGPIPRPLRPLLGRWVFGCDACQEACPWNRRKPAVEGYLFTARDDLRALDLAGLLRLDPDAFRRRFGGTALMRARRSGLLRNAAVVLGNSADPAVVPVLRGALNDPEPLVRGHAAWALGRLAGADARQGLQEACGKETDSTVREELDLALAAASG